MSKRKALSKLSILCWATFIAIPGHMWPVGCGLDPPALNNQTGTAKAGISKHLLQRATVNIFRLVAKKCLGRSYATVFVAGKWWLTLCEQMGVAASQ